MAQRYTIKEFDCFTRNKSIPGGKFTQLSEKTFDQLEQFILENRAESETEALELMSVSSRPRVGKIISAKNYVGLIMMNDGTEIEILPKIYSEKTQDSETTKRIFLDMLKTVKDIPYKTFNVSSLNAEHINIFEIKRD